MSLQTLQRSKYTTGFCNTNPCRDEKEADNEIDKDVEAHVREYFSDIPIMVEVARCESHFTQFTKSGKVLRGKAVPADVGVMQINETYHLDRASKLGYDIHTLDGNLDYARHLYEEQELDHG